MSSWLAQGYFDDLAEYLRVGPPLYFVVKDYNYRYQAFIIFYAIDRACAHGLEVIL